VTGVTTSGICSTGSALRNVYDVARQGGTDTEMELGGWSRQRPPGRLTETVACAQRVADIASARDREPRTETTSARRFDREDRLR
jgi:hypothetical protein